jgi:hypothetical protein
MKPTKVYYQCEECGAEFYRNVKEVLIDDAEDCHVIVDLLVNAEGDIEEFPMCACLGGAAEYTITHDTASDSAE